MMQLLFRLHSPRDLIVGVMADVLIGVLTRPKLLDLTMKEWHQKTEQADSEE